MTFPILGALRLGDMRPCTLCNRPTGRGFSRDTESPATPLCPGCVAAGDHERIEALALLRIALRFQASWEGPDAAHDAANVIVDHLRDQIGTSAAELEERWGAALADLLYGKPLPTLTHNGFECVVTMTDVLRFQRAVMDALNPGRVRRFIDDFRDIDQGRTPKP